MENITDQILSGKKNATIAGSRSDILNNFSKNINVESLIDDGILKISDDVKWYIDSFGYSIKDILKLSRLYKPYATLSSININFDNFSKVLNVEIIGKLFSIDTGIYIFNGFIHNSKINTKLSNISGFKAVVNQIKIAKEKGFNYITCFAAREDILVGYYYWPMLGFRAKSDINIFDIVVQSNDTYIKSCKTLNELFDLQDKDGNYIGMSFWEENGFGFDAKFDLADGSKSIQKLNEYILSKKQSNPEKYIDIDVIK